MARSIGNHLYGIKFLQGRNGRIFRIMILLAVLTSSCIRVNPYHCPSIDDQFKVMNPKDSKNLGRKKYKFKKAQPKLERREGYGGDGLELE